MPGLGKKQLKQDGILNSTVLTAAFAVKHQFVKIEEQQSSP